MANEVIIPVKYVVDDTDLSKAGAKLGALTAEEKKLEAEMNDVAAAARKQTTAFNQAGDAGTKAAKETEKQYSMLGNSMASIGGMIAGAFAIDRLLALGKEVIQVTATFQRLSAVLATSLGSQSAANIALARIQQYATETPYSVEQVTASFVKLAARGFQPTNAELKKLGDLAASTGKDFDQLTEALLDAQTGEFERLKEFGITARSEGDKVKFTFGETTTEVKKTNEAIKDYVLSLGDLAQVSGSAANISNTLGGKLNNLGDTFDQLWATLGEGTSGVLTDTIDLFSKLITNTTKLIDPIGTATKAAVANVSDFETQITKSLNNLAEKTKNEGGDVGAAVAGRVAKIRESITSQLSGAQQALDDVNKKVNNIPEALRAFGLPKGLEKQLADSTARVKFLQAELTTLDGIISKRNKAERQSAEEKAKAEKEAADKAAKAAEDAFKKKDKSRISYLGISTEELDKFVELSDDFLKVDRETQKKQSDERIKESAKRIKTAEFEADEQKRIADELAAYKQQLTNETIALASFAADAYVQFSSYESEQRISQLQQQSEQEQQMTGDNLAAREQIEDSYNKRIAREKEEQAKKEKAAALFQVSVDTATSIIKTGAELGYPAAIPFQIMAGVQGALQAALIAARPIPKFAQGTRSVQGGIPGQDSVLAMLMPGERVITTEKNRQLSPAFDVLTNSKLPATVWNKTLLEIEKMGVFTPPKLRDLPAGGTGGALDTDRIVAAVRGIVIERTVFDERGVTRYTERELTRIRRLNKRYGFG